MYFAIKTIEGEVVDKIMDDWSSCKSLVFGKDNCIYKSFIQEDEAKEYLRTLVVTTKAEGYEKIDNTVLKGK